MEKRNPYQEYHKHKASDKKRHDQRHPKGTYGHFCSSWMGHYICEDCVEFKTCECGAAKPIESPKPRLGRISWTPDTRIGKYPS